MISLDYAEPRTKEGKWEKVNSMLILVMTDRRSKWISGIMVPEKGLNAYAVAAMGREISLSGYNKVILKSARNPRYSFCLRL